MISFRLDNSTLFSLARRVTNRAKGLREKIVKRTTEGRRFAVWEMPFGQVQAIQSFVEDLKEVFPPEIMQETLLFVNNGNGGAYQSYLAVGFPEIVFPHVQPALNAVVGVNRNFELAPELLISLAVQGIFDMETKLTPAKIERAYGKQPPTS